MRKFIRRIILIDNFDSFTYNIVQAYQKLGAEVTVIRNHLTTLDDMRSRHPHLVVIGPGPGRPEGAGISRQCVALAHEGIPVFGICLGHQAIGEVFGAQLIRAPQAVHGKTSPINHLGEGVFTGLPQGFLATRYHSLILERSSLPPNLKVTAWAAEDEVMGIRHASLPLEGVQFHPESAASEYGLSLLANSLP